MYAGARGSFSTLEAVEPYVRGPDVQKYTATGGESYILRRSGPEAHQLDVSVSCWSGTIRPDRCCGHDAPDCWGLHEFQERCCSLGVGKTVDSQFFVYDVHLMVSGYFSLEKRAAWDQTFPGYRIDEAAFAEKRTRWRLGAGDPGSICPSAGVSADGVVVKAIDTEVVVWPLIKLLTAAGVPLSRTFLNVGAGTCLPPDPLYRLAHSAEGRGFAGLAVDANASDLQMCSSAMHNATARVIPVHAGVDPLTAAQRLRPHLAALFADGRGGGGGPPWPLDVMVMDIDGCDCLVAEELLRLVRPKVLVLEIAFHIPPPFRFSSQHDVERSDAWLRDYDVRKFNPIGGCSLSYALHRFRPYGLHLFRLTHLDAVLVHESLAPVLEPATGLRFPLDELECYRRSVLWMQMPVATVREWFFSAHPADSFGHIWANITQMSAELKRPLAPFALDY